MVFVGPRVRGNQLLGAVDTRNGWISGFDLDTGVATPFHALGPDDEPVADDPLLPPGEDVMFGATLDLLGITYDGQQNLPALRV